MEIIDNIREHIGPYMEIFGYLICIVTVIAGITPSDRDDTILANIGKWADRIGIKIKGK
jgi:hypothetical protein